MKRLTFKEYFESKRELLEGSTVPVKFTTTHNVYKYCKVPFTLNEKKIYIPFKPKDVIIVEWQRVDHNILPISFSIKENIYIPVWNSVKMRTWVEQTATQQI